MTSIIYVGGVKNETSGKTKVKEKRIFKIARNDKIPKLGARLSLRCITLILAIFFPTNPPDCEDSPNPK